MGPITPVNVGSATPLNNLAPTPNNSTNAVGTGGGVLSGASTLSGHSLAVTQVHSAVSQLMQTVGNGVENNKALQMLIVLMILLALLENARGSSNGANDALMALGGGSGGQSQFFGVFSSSTTIEIHQTTTTAVFGSAESLSAGLSGGEPAPGGEIDVSA